MGAKNSNITNSSFEDYSKSNTSANSSCFLLCSNFISPSSNQKPQKNLNKWKSDLKSNCKKLFKTFEWTDLLLKYLYKDNESDSLFQSELKLIINSKEIEFKKLNTDQRDTTSFLFPNKSVKNSIDDISSKKLNYKDDFRLSDDELKKDREISAINRLSDKNISLALSNNPLNMMPLPIEFVHYSSYEIFNEKKLIRDTLEFNDDENTDNFLAMQKFANTFELIEKHLENEKNSLANVKKIYINFFKNKYEKFCYNDPKNNDLIELENQIIKIANDLKTFIWIFKDCLRDYYSLNEIGEKFKTKDFIMFSNENIITFLLSIVINDDIYSIIFDSIRKLDKFKEFSFKRNLNLMKNYSPENFLVPYKYSLNENTINFFKENKNNQKKQKILQEKINYEALLTKVFPHLLLNSFQVSDNFENEKEKGYFRRINSQLSFKGENPYSVSIDLLRNIPFLKNPAHKIKLIINIFNEINENIKEFYSIHDIKEKKIKLEPEELISIVVYIVSQAGIGNMISQIHFIEKFFSENNLTGKIGYFFYYLKAACEYILNAIEE